MRALNSAVTGLQAQQTAMDVIGNNIANVNTDGYKSTTANFEDLFYQTLDGSTSTTDPTQVGYGTKVSSISKNMDTGDETSTDVSTDLYIDGSGYFVVNTGTGTTETLQYTRNGEFHFSSDGHLVDSNGDDVMGATTDSSTDTTTLEAVDLTGATFKTTDGDTTYTIGSATGDISLSSSELSDITINTDGTISAEVNGTAGYFYDSNGNEITVALANFANEGGLTQAGNTSFTASAASGAATYFKPDVNGNSTTLISGALEQSNVDLSKEFTNMIVTQRGFQANSRVITVADTLLEEIVNLKRS